MFKSWKLGSAFGIGVHVHWTFLLVLLFVLAMTAGSPQGPVFYVAFVLAVFGCVVLHEFGHALTARHFGISTRDITIYPIGGVARLERMSENPWEEFWIAVAGPAVNVVIVTMLVVTGLLVEIFQPGLLGFGAHVETATDLPVSTQFLLNLLVGNVLLVGFNMIPAYPMDGGRVLRALMSACLGHVQGTRVAVRVAAVVTLLMAVLGPYLFGWWMMPVIALVVFVFGQRELYALEMRERARRRQEEEPLEVLPVRRPDPSPALDLRPTVLIYTWDAKNGVWVSEPTSQPMRVNYGNLQ